MKLLHIDSSILSDNSISRQLTHTIVAQWRRTEPALEVAYRDLAADAPAHLSAAVLNAGTTPPQKHSALQHAELMRSETLLTELLTADALVIGAPMYNFSIPSQLKAWLDRVMVAGRTFKYTENGPVGLVNGKQAIIVSTRGGVYAADSPAQIMDHQESYLKAALGFIGITNITVVRAEGVDMKENRAQAIAAAEAHIHRLLPGAA